MIASQVFLQQETEKLADGKGERRCCKMVRRNRRGGVEDRWTKIVRNERGTQSECLVHGTARGCDGSLGM